MIPKSTHGRQLMLQDGKRLGYGVYGDPTGRPVYFIHGFPGSHEQALLVADQAASLGVALIAFDRPGFGDSTPDPRATIDTVVADLVELANHMGHPAFSVVGVSCGGPYALAAARLAPRRITSVALLGGIGPMDRPEIRRDQMPLLKVMFALARLHPWLVSPLLLADWCLFRSSAERAVAALSRMMTAPDQALLKTRATVRGHFGLSLTRAYAQGIRGAMREAARIAAFRSDSLQGIHVPVHLYQGLHDGNVPVEMARYMASVLPRAVLHECPTDGHLSVVVNRFSECLSDLV